MIKACIFDLDGVIVDTAKYHYLAWKRLAEKLDIPFSEEENETMKGISRMASLEKLLQLGNIELTNDDKEKYCAVKNIWYLEFVSSMGKEETLPGVQEFIAELKKNGILIGLGSASKNARTILEKIDITDLFDVIIDGNDVIKSKPDPEVFSKGAALLDCLPGETIVIEDSAKGIDAAISGGFMTIGIGEEEYLGHADLVVQDLQNISLDDLSEIFQN